MPPSWLEIHNVLVLLAPWGFIQEQSATCSCGEVFVYGFMPIQVHHGLSLASSMHHQHDPWPLVNHSWPHQLINMIHDHWLTFDDHINLSSSFLFIYHDHAVSLVISHRWPPTSVGINDNSINNLPLCHWWQHSFNNLCSPFHHASLLSPFGINGKGYPFSVFTPPFIRIFVFCSILSIIFLAPPVIMLFQLYLPLFALREKGNTS